MAQYQVFNGISPVTSAVQIAVTTNTNNPVTLMQIKPIVPVHIVAWGIAFDGAAAAAGTKCELLETDGAATVTAYVAGDFNQYDDAALSQGDPTGTVFTITSNTSGYNPNGGTSGEGTITVSRMFDSTIVQPTNQYIYQFPLGARPVLRAGKYGRIRVKAPNAVNAICYMLLEV